MEHGFYLDDTQVTNNLGTDLFKQLTGSGDTLTQINENNKFLEQQEEKKNDITESKRKRGKGETVGNRTKGYRKTIGYEIKEQRETNVDKC